MQFNLFDPNLSNQLPELPASTNILYYHRDPGVVLPDVTHFLSSVTLPVNLPNTTYEVINTQEAWEQVLCEMLRCGWIAYDSETEGLNRLVHRIIGHCFTYRLDGKAPESLFDPSLRHVYVPVRHRTGEQCLQADYVNSGLSPLMEDGYRSWLMWNPSYDEHMLANDKLRVRGKVWDGYLPRKLMHPAQTGKLKVSASELMDSNALEALDALQMYTKLVCQKNGWPVPNRKKKDPLGRSFYEYSPLCLMGCYGPRDTHYTWGCGGEYLRRIQLHPALSALNEMEQCFREPLWEMERLGLYVNQATRRASVLQVDELMLGEEEKSHQLAGRVFNLGSPQEIVDVFTGVGIQLTTTTKNTRNKPKEEQVLSTEAKVLVRLAQKGHDLPAHILRWRQLRELKTKSLKYMDELVGPDGCLHTSYHQIGAESARCMSSGPNVQNFPNKGEQKELIRGCFEIHPEFQRRGFVWVFGDLSQIELRILAHITRDPVFLEAYWQGRDVHTETAIRIFGKTAWDIAGPNKRSEMRAAAKAINFGIIYMIGPKGLSDQLFQAGIHKTTKECEVFINTFKNIFPVTMDWIEQIKWSARKQGYLTNMYGRFVDTSVLRDSSLSKWQQEEWERTYVNWVIQSSAADFFKSGIVWLHQKRKEEGWTEGWKWVNNIHDELQYYIRPDWLQSSVHWMKYCYEEVVSKGLDVPIKIDAETSRDTWLNKEPLVLAA